MNRLFIDVQGWVTVISTIIAFAGILLSLYISLREQPIQLKAKLVYYKQNAKSKILVINRGNGSFLIHGVGIKIGQDYYVVKEIKCSKRYRLPVYDNNNKVIMTNISKFKMVSEPGDVINIECLSTNLQDIINLPGKVFVLINTKFYFIKTKPSSPSKNQELVFKEMLKMSKEEAKYFN